MRISLNVSALSNVNWMQSDSLRKRRSYASTAVVVESVHRNGARCVVQNQRFVPFVAGKQQQTVRDGQCQRSWAIVSGMRSDQCWDVQSAASSGLESGLVSSARWWVIRSTPDEHTTQSSVGQLYTSMPEQSVFEPLQSMEQS